MNSFKELRLSFEKLDRGEISRGELETKCIRILESQEEEITRLKNKVSHLEWAEPLPQFPNEGM